MKTRTGFVSNSSSSSFIVRFTQDPTDKEQLAEMLGDCSANGYRMVIPTEKVVDTIHAELTRDQGDDPYAQYPFKVDRWDFDYDMANVVDEYSGYTIEDGDEKDALVDEITKIELEHRLKLWCLINKTTLEEHAEKNKFTHTFTFSDECGDFWAAMESGNVFRNVDHDYESNH